MRFWSAPRKPLLPRGQLVRIASIAILIALLCGWTTCNAIITLNGCEQSAPQITSLAPSTISGNADSTMLTVSGNNFSPQSEILWNGSALPTTFINARTLQTTVTQQTMTLAGGTGTTVQISVISPAASGCSNSVSSAIFVLTID